MEFDYVSRAACGISFGVVRGGDRVVFIKAGLGGSCSGYEDKYIRIARRLNEKYGCSVIAASNPEGERSHAKADREIIEKYLAAEGIGTPVLYFFGHSNGGIKGLELAASGLLLEKMLLINMPLMINMHKTRKYLAALGCTRITLVYGEADPSFSYLPFIEGRYANVNTLTVAGADHNFAGMTDRLVELGDLLMDV